jgi:hypothetical protein
MANNLTNHDGLIIIGVDEGNDFSIADTTDDPNKKTTQNLVDFLRSKKFAGGYRPTVTVEALCIAQGQIDVITIKNDLNIPYYLDEKYQNVIEGHIYVRIADTNTPVNKLADRHVVERLWRKHLRLDVPIIETLSYYLTKPSDWDITYDPDESLYYRFAPEFTVSQIPNDDLKGYEFYFYAQTDSTPRWYEIVFRYHQTVIASFQGIALDGARYFTNVPKLGGFGEGCLGWKYSYPYFIEGSLGYLTHRFFYKEGKDECTWAHNKFVEYVLFFESEEERISFNEYANYNNKKLNEAIQAVKDFPLPEHLSELEAAEHQRRFKQSLALQQMLLDFREEEWKTATDNYLQRRDCSVYEYNSIADTRLR